MKSPHTVIITPHRVLSNLLSTSRPSGGNNFPFSKSPPTSNCLGAISFRIFHTLPSHIAIKRGSFSSIGIGFYRGKSIDRNRCRWSCGRTKLTAVPFFDFYRALVPFCGCLGRFSIGHGGFGRNCGIHFFWSFFLSITRNLIWFYFLFFQETA